MSNSSSRREFVKSVGLAASAMGLGGTALAQDKNQQPKDASGNVIAGFEKTQTNPSASSGWQPFSDRKIRVGIAGFGLCQFGTQFGFQNHPNVEVVAVTV